MKRKRNIAVLIIPEDKNEPISFKISVRFLKIMIPLGILFAIHVVLGGIYYWKYADSRRKNIRLEMEKSKLEEDNKRIYKIANDFAKLKAIDEKIRSALGVHFGYTSIPEEIKDAKGEYTPYPPTFEEGKVRKTDISQKLDYLSQPKSQFRNYADNLPTLLPVEGILTSGFKNKGFLPTEKHLGIDIAAKQGSVVRAAGNGWIVFANWTLELGNLVIIYHGADIFTYYAHNMSILKKEKSFVKKGQPIALLGSSGIASTGPHLHFEIWKNGTPLNPKECLLAFQTQ